MHQLGHGPDEIERLPREIKAKRPLGKISQVSAGGQHSVILINE